MRTILTLIAVSALMVGCDHAEPVSQAEPAASDVSTDDAPAVNANLVTLEFAVKGMHCGGCVNFVQSTIKDIDGVADCTVVLDEGAATVHAEDEAAAELILAAFEDKTYEVTRKQ